MRQYYAAILNGLIEDTPVPLDVPFRDLPAHFKSLLFFGSGDRAISVQVSAERKVSKPFEGLVAQMQRLFDTSESEFTRKRLRAFQGRRVCGVCAGRAAASGDSRRDDFRRQTGASTTSTNSARFRFPRPAKSWRESRSAERKRRSFATCCVRSGKGSVS